MNKKNVLKRGLFFLLFALMTAASAAPNSSVKTHVMSLEVRLNGKTIMTPNVEVLPDTYGTVSLLDENGKPTYSLKFAVTEESTSTQSAYGLDASLYQGNSLTGNVLANPTMMFKEGMQPEATVSNNQNTVTIKVVSHAVKDRNLTAQQFDSAKLGCGNSEDGVSTRIITAGENCCSRRCDGPGGTLTCCNVISCCGCGVCCHVP